METNRILAKMLISLEEKATQELDTANQEIECLEAYLYDKQKNIKSM